MSVELDSMDERVELKPDEANELFFKITVEGTDRAPDAIRLVCDAGEVTYAFKGEATIETNVMRFVVPPLNSMVKPGVQYDTSIEVLVENKYFVPVRFKSEFKQPVRVTVESVKRVSAPIVEKKEPTTQAPLTTSPAKPTIEVKAQQVKPTSLREKYAQQKKAK